MNSEDLRKQANAILESISAEYHALSEKSMNYYANTHAMSNGRTNPSPQDQDWAKQKTINELLPTRVRQIRRGASAAFTILLAISVAQITFIGALPFQEFSAGIWTVFFLGVGILFVSLTGILTSLR